MAYMAEVKNKYIPTGMTSNSQLTNRHINVCHLIWLLFARTAHWKGFQLILHWRNQPSMWVIVLSLGFILNRISLKCIFPAIVLWSHLSKCHWYSTDCVVSCFKERRNIAFLDCYSRLLTLKMNKMTGIMCYGTLRNRVDAKHFWGVF